MKTALLQSYRNNFIDFSSSLDTALLAFYVIGTKLLTLATPGEWEEIKYTL